MELLSSTALGDIVTIAPRPALSIRSKVVFSPPMHEVNGFVVLGECEAAVVVRRSRGKLLLPSAEVPESVRCGRSIAAGSASYWAPHLPGFTGAMGSILWRLVTPRGSVDLALFVWRGPERVVFVPVADLDAQQLSMLYMPRTDNDVDVTRYQARVVSPVGAPVDVPVVPERATVR